MNWGCVGCRVKGCLGAFGQPLFHLSCPMHSWQVREPKASPHRGLLPTVQVIRRTRETTTNWEATSPSSSYSPGGALDPQVRELCLSLWLSAPAWGLSAAWVLCCPMATLASQASLRCGSLSQREHSQPFLSILQQLPPHKQSSLEPPLWRRHTPQLGFPSACSVEHSLFCSALWKRICDQLGLRNGSC